ncbi:MAG: hypothetical protein COT88_01425 [Candidatus Colwellbacteria bacterium CG10_big_fil_rev_8_21_14_0_10_41_28]|uniref:AAA+ ATPase domain-containing protein n=1 Tax=Candidatus Colwellbacteria bacterium CG10_big_fil_rev_8_21_14_0_10_41_28 TaxID=1974539 RepID=A0A2H0VHA5_9BACT|nr:MAG: hypothetical protein COT88_01425 [Candidatus Colwellbacteria bacterium CG10_big_fil_rev_8_21_14_0_10_41_28]
MILGHSEKIKIFKDLADKDGLSHAYLFYGPEQVGKNHFAKALSAYLEHGEFEESKRLLSETLTVLPGEDKDSIGIDEVRVAKTFLYRKPVNSEKRLVIIDNSDLLTSQAQNAILKITEEPPKTGIIILITKNPDTLLPTLRSRVQQVYFSRLKSDDLKNFLKKERGLADDEIERIVKLSFGRPGRMFDLIDTDKYKDLLKIFNNLKKDSKVKRSTIEEISKEGDYRELLDYLIAVLSEKPLENYKLLAKIMDAKQKMGDYSTNKRLQLESALWNI